MIGIQYPTNILNIFMNMVNMYAYDWPIQLLAILLQLAPSFLATIGWIRTCVKRLTVISTDLWHMLLVVIAKLVGCCTQAIHPYATNACIRGVTMIMSAHIIHCVFHAYHTIIMSPSIIHRVVRNYIVMHPLRFCTCPRTMLNACNTCPYCMESPKYESCVTWR